VSKNGPEALVFVDHGESSRIRDRPEWLACLDYLRPGDTLIVPALSRLAGTTTMAIETINDLHERGINIKSVTEPDIDTIPAMGRALFAIVAVFAQLRVDTIRENTRRGLEHARAQGRIAGRPTVMSPERSRPQLGCEMPAAAHRETARRRRRSNLSSARAPHRPGRPVRQAAVSTTRWITRSRSWCRLLSRP
jgi:DNA invertase Pin-like site-specific DNA recombinase